MILKKIDNGSMLQINKNIYGFKFNSFGSCVYLIKQKDKNILIDTSSKENKQGLIKALDKVGLVPDNIDILLLTHSHFDHIGNIDLFKIAKIYDKNNISDLNIKEIKVYHVPGHTKDSLAFLYKGVLFSGDTLFNDNIIGRTDFKESAPEKMQESLKLLKNLKYKFLAPGHLLD